MSIRLSVPVVIASCLALVCAPLHAQPPGGPPAWIDDLDPTRYILLAADLKPPFAWGTDAQFEAQGQGVHLDDGQGHITEQTTVFVSSVQTIKLAQPYANTAATTPPTPMRWEIDWRVAVGIYQTEEVAKAAVRAHYLSAAGPLITEDENCLNDPRLSRGRGAAGAMGRLVRYRNLILMISTGDISEVQGDRPPIDRGPWNGAYAQAQMHQQDLIAVLARLWLDKVAGPDRPNLHVEPGNVYFKLGGPSPLVEREPSADQQYVLAVVGNLSTTVTATGAQAQLLVGWPGDAEMRPIGRPVRLPDIPPGGSKGATFYWDLDGKNIENALLRVEVSIPGLDDDDPADNHCELKCSIYSAHNATSAYRWVDDSYSFDNYGYKGREGIEMVEGILATVIRQLYTDPQATTLLTRLMFPQTYTRLMDYLHTSVNVGGIGHCYGMVATAALYFLDASLRPGAARTCDLTRDAASANINIYQRAQLVPVAQAIISGETFMEDTVGAATALNTIRAILKDQRRPVMVSIFGKTEEGRQVVVDGQPEIRWVERWWGHALLAYKLVEVPGQASIVYVYDPNLPPQAQWGTTNPMSYIHIDPATGGWNVAPYMALRYPGLEAISARAVTGEVSIAEANALVPVLRAKLDEMIAWFDKANKLMATLHCPADALFTDAQGRRVGVVGGQQVNEIPGAEIRAAGEAEIYILPRNLQYSVTITGTGAGEAGLDIIRAVNGAPEVTVFAGMAVAAGSGLQGTMAAGGTLERITSANGQRSYTPTMIGALSGDRVTWRTGAQAPSTPVSTPPTPPTPPPAAAPRLGELVICRSVDNGQASGAASHFAQTPEVWCLLRYRGLPAGTAECVWTRGGQEVTRSQREISAGNGWVAFALSTQDAGGLAAGAYEAVVSVAGQQARASFTVGTPAGGPRGGGGAPPAGNTPTGGSLELKGGASSIPGGSDYPRTDGALSLFIRYSAPGTVLDTVGIGNATPGDFSLVLNEQGTLTWQIYQPGIAGAHRADNGWHFLTTDTALRPGVWTRVKLTWGTRGMRVAIDGQLAASDSAQLPLSGSPLFFGDFPGDNGYTAYHPLRSFTGEVADITFE